MTGRMSLAALALSISLASSVCAQSRTAPEPAAAKSAAAPKDSQVFRSGDVLPEPTEMAPDAAAGAAPLPAGPIDPFLIDVNAGPFMVLAHTFRGPDAVRQAQALVMELRGQHRLPAYIFYLKLKPGNSNIQGIPPTAPRYVGKPKVTAPEVNRVTDEAAVLVGHCKTIDDAEDLLKQVKKIQPTCLGGGQSMFHWRNGKGLSRAMITTNPLLPAQDLYPGGQQRIQHAGPGSPPPPVTLQNGSVVDPDVLRSTFVPKADPLIKRMNQGPNSIFNCPGPYTMVVAEFSGRSSFDTKESIFRLPDGLKDSPLKTAHEDAEDFAEKLADDPKIQALGVRPYVYHDRTSSRVMLGGYNSQADPNAKRVYQGALGVSVQIKHNGEKTSQYLAPSLNLIETPRP
jgi:hypothetical protein